MGVLIRVMASAVSWSAMIVGSEVTVVMWSCGVAVVTVGL